MAMNKISIVISSRQKDLGGFSVRRILPYAGARMVGPFIFFDHMGPADFPAGQGITVRPHPHIHLATVTYLFEGKIRHRDSLGNDQLIEPGAINWMTAGKGIVHSERAPEDFLKKGGRLNGIQLWVALPDEAQDCEPCFTHHPANSLPEITIDGVKIKLLLGEAFEQKSPVAVHSDLFYAEAIFPAGAKITVPAQQRENAVYVVSGKVQIEGKILEPFCMAVIRMNEDIEITALEPSRLMLLGGKPVGKRFIYWNFVSSSEENLRAASGEWARGPGSSRFPKIPGDDQDFIPLPE